MSAAVRASAAVSDPVRRARLERLEDWAARRTPTEHAELEREAERAIRDRGRTLVQ